MEFSEQVASFALKVLKAVAQSRLGVQGFRSTLQAHFAHQVTHTTAAFNRIREEGLI